MNDIQEIEVFIEPNGNVKVEVRGVKGEQCLALTREMEELLGEKIGERRYTDELYQGRQERSLDDQLKQRVR